VVADLSYGPGREPVWPRPWMALCYGRSRRARSTRCCRGCQPGP